MTRINVIDPQYLTDQHLMAEYRELPMVMGSLRRTLASRNGWQQSKVPTSYKLDTGHVYFFTNKGKWLERRYHALIDELKLRGYSIDPKRVADFSVFHDAGLYGDWVADMNAVQINSVRIKQRILDKPDWYRYHRRRVTELPLFHTLLQPTQVWR